MTSGSPRFLVVRLGSLGDIVHTIPAVAALRRHYPAARIDWVVEPQYVPVLSLVKGVDDAVPVALRGGLGSALAAIGRLRRVRYDAAIDLQGLIKSALLARAVGARRTIGFSTPHLRESLASMFYSEAADPGGRTHVVEKSLAALASVGVEDVGVTFPLDIPQTAAADVVAGQVGEGGYAVINPGAAWPNKRWPAERFGALAATLRARLGLRSLVLWGPDEQPLAEAVVGHAGGAATVAPPTSIVDLFAVLQRARVLISGDTGPLHIGAAVGTPVVALFGPTFPERNGPWSPEGISISCAGSCDCHYERRCRRSTPCIEGIAVEEVVAAVERRLDV